MKNGTYIYFGPRIVDGEYVDRPGLPLMRFLVTDDGVIDWDTGEAPDPLMLFHLLINWKSKAIPYPLKKQEFH